MLRETDGTWDNGYTHAWTQVRAALRRRRVGSCIASRPAFSHGARPRPAPSRAARRRTSSEVARASGLNVSVVVSPGSTGSSASATDGGAASSIYFFRFSTFFGGGLPSREACIFFMPHKQRHVDYRSRPDSHKFLQGFAGFADVPQARVAHQVSFLRTR